MTVERALEEIVGAEHRGTKAFWAAGVYCLHRGVGWAAPFFRAAFFLYEEALWPRDFEDLEAKAQELWRRTEGLRRPSERKGPAYRRGGEDVYRAQGELLRLGLKEEPERREAWLQMASTVPADRLLAMDLLRQELLQRGVPGREVARFLRENRGAFTNPTPGTRFSLGVALPPPPPF